MYVCMLMQLLFIKSHRGHASILEDTKSCMRMSNFRGSCSLMLALMVNFAIIDGRRARIRSSHSNQDMVTVHGTDGRAQRQRHGLSSLLSPFHDIPFRHAVERLLLNINPEVVKDDGINTSKANNDHRHSNNGSFNKIIPHGYMHIVFRDALDNMSLLVKKYGDGAGGIILGIEPIQDRKNNSDSTTLTFEMNFMNATIDEVFTIELAFRRPKDAHEDVVIDQMDVAIGNGNPFRLEVKLHKSTIENSSTNQSECYHSVQVPLQEFQRWWNDQPKDRKCTTLILHLHQSTKTRIVQRPLLVLYARLNQSRVEAEHLLVRRAMATYIIGRARRSTNLPIPTCKRCTYAVRKELLNTTPSTAKAHPKTAKRDACGLRQWTVTTADLKWDTWVIAPQALELNYCSGPCQALIMDATHATTNHAIIRNMFLADHGYTKISDQISDIPPPYCVPIMFKPASIMYHDSGQIIIKNLDNMIVKKCGCS